MLLNRRDFVKRSALLAGVAIGAPSVLTGCDLGITTGGKDILETAREQGFINVGFANEAPYGYQDAQGKLTGEAPEVARRVMQELGVPEIRGVLTEFGSLIPGLNANRFDLIAAGMFITPQRCQEILFSDPDYCAPEALAVPAGNPLGLQTYEDVAANPQVRLGVIAGAVEGGYARAAGVSDAQITQFPDPPSGIEGLQANRIDALSLTRISLNYLIEEVGASGVEVAEPFVPVVNGVEQKTCGGYGFRKDNEKFRDAFNEKLNELKQNGQLLEIIKPFGFTEDELPPDGTTAQELCAAGEQSATPGS